ncbi:S8 family serine peptidase [Streptomyces sp. NPDC059989]|uniref:S8 family serine peptidase n=1 Tax=Streptomyces sp. NPDC059989 TaxID=3347026 RepID=UPI0036A7520D
MVSAACPSCKILLVQANDDTFGNLLTAVAQARTQGAKYISMSWGDSSGENNVRPVLDQIYFNFPGIAFVGSSGNFGVVQWPAASRYVTAAGGTTLRRNFLPVPGPQFLRFGWRVPRQHLPVQGGPRLRRPHRRRQPPRGPRPAALTTGRGRTVERKVVALGRFEPLRWPLALAPGEHLARRLVRLCPGLAVRQYVHDRLELRARVENTWQGGRETVTLTPMTTHSAFRLGVPTAQGEC